MDICDDPASPHITATFELPGVKREEIKLNIHEGNLIVRGERRSRLTPLTTRPSNGISSLPVHPISAADTIASGEMMETDAIALPVKYPVQEVRYGKFHRAVALPQGAKVSSLPFHPSFTTQFRISKLFRNQTLFLPYLTILPPIVKRLRTDHTDSCPPFHF